MSALLDMPDGPLWYRQWIVLESYIKAVVCWRLRRLDEPVVDAEARWRPLQIARLMPTRGALR